MAELVNIFAIVCPLYRKRQICGEMSGHIGMARYGISPAPLENNRAPCISGIWRERATMETSVKSIINGVPDDVP